MNFLEMNVNEAVDTLREKKYMHNIPHDSVIHICNIPNDRYISCNRYIAKCKDGIVEFLATEHRGVCSDEFIDIIRVLDNEKGKEAVENEINRIREQSEERIHHEKVILKHLSF